jgi:tape measure domain-containing protein
MAKGDVELVVRATNQAKSALDQITQALESLTTAQNSTGTSATQTGERLTALGEDLVSLKGRAEALQIFATIVEQFKVAQAAADRLSQELTRTIEELNRLRDTTAAASTQTAALAERSKVVTAAYNEQKIAVQQAKAALTGINAEVRAASAAYAPLATKIKSLAEPNAQLNEQLNRQGAALEALKAKQTQFREALDQERNALKQAAAAQKELQTAIQVSAANEQRLQATFDRTTQSVQRQQGVVAQSDARLSEMSEIVSRASAALGGLAVAEDAVAIAAQKTAIDIKTVTQALQAQQATNVTGTVAQGPAAAAVTAYRAQIQALDQTRTAMLQVQAVTTELGRAMAAAAEPSETLRRQFLLAQEASAQAKAEYLAQAQALNILRGATQGGFAAFAQAESALQTLVSAESKATAETRTLASSLLALARTFVTFNSAASEGGGKIGIFRSALTAVTGETRTALGIVQRMRGQVLALASGYVGLIGAIQGISTVITTIRTLEQAQNRLGAVFHQDSGKVAADMAFLGGQSNRLGFDFGTLSDAYTKLAVSASTAGFSSDATRKIFLSVAEAGRVNKLSIDDLRLVFLALEQMINKGTVQSEELKRQLGNTLPGAFEIFAASARVSTGELQKMLKAGEVLADQPTLLAFARQLDKVFGPQLSTSLESVTTSLGRLQNSFFNAAREVAEGGFSTGLKQFLDELNNFFKSDDGRQFFETIGNGLSVVLGGLKLLVEHFQAVFDIIELIIALKVGQFFNTLFVQIAAASPAFATFNVAVAGSLASMETLGVALAKIGVAVKAFGLSLVAIPARLAAVEVSTLTLGGVCTAVALGGVNLLRIGLSALAGIAGGLPGLIVAFALSWGLMKFLEWTSGTKEVNDALADHAKLLQDATDALDHTSKATAEYRKQLAGLTLTGLEKNFLDLKEQAKAVTDQLNDAVESIKNAQSSDPRVALDLSQLQELAQKVVENKLSVNGLVKSLADLALSLRTPDAIRLANDLEEAARKAQVFNNAGEETQKAVRQLGGAMDGLDKPVIDLENNLNNAGKSASKTASQLDTTTTATNNFKTAAEGTSASQAKLTTDVEGSWGLILSTISDAIDSIGGFFDQLGTAAASAWESFASAAESAISSAIAGIKDLISWIARAITGANEARSAAQSATTGSGHAGGGLISGPGTGTSDSIGAWLSDGEWVIKAAAVKKYGNALFSALNSMRLPREFSHFAAGGPVVGSMLSGPVKFAEGGPVAGETRRVRLDLNILGQSFEGLLAPHDVADRLIKFAMNEQVRSAGRKPGWYLG